MIRKDIDVDIDFTHKGNVWTLVRVYDDSNNLVADKIKVDSLYDFSDNQLLYNNKDTDRVNFNIAYNLNSGQTYYICVGSNGRINGTYTLLINRLHQDIFDSVMYRLDYTILPLGDRIKYIYDANGNLKQKTNQE